MIGDGCGQGGFVVQYEEAVWQPLVEAVGERIAGGFMWMHEEALDDGSRLHAYKHVHTRSYLYLTLDGRAFQPSSCGRLVPQRLDYALQHAICGWWILAGWDEKDAEEVRHAITRANAAAALES